MHLFYVICIDPTGGKIPIPLLFQFEVYATLVLFVPYFAFYDRLKAPIPP